MKTCKKCSQYKSLDSFEKHRNVCKTCRNEHRKTFGSRSGTGLRNYMLKKTYGIDLEIYNKMLQEQDGVCKICKKPDNGPHGVLSVDHCHKTGKVRSLLCATCNKGLGQFKDSPELLTVAIEYLKAHSFCR